jgi:hypothetical protein
MTQPEFDTWYTIAIATDEDLRRWLKIYVNPNMVVSDKNRGWLVIEVAEHFPKIGPFLMPFYPKPGSVK